MMEKDSLNVLILAAGLGTRLRPLTNDMPKPLVPVVDASILDLQARKARAIGNVRLHANAHYLAEQVVEAGLARLPLSNHNPFGSVVVRGYHLDHIHSRFERGEVYRARCPARENGLARCGEYGYLAVVNSV